MIPTDPGSILMLMVIAAGSAAISGGLLLQRRRRAKQLLRGARPLVEPENKEVVTALREVAAGVVSPVTEGAEAR